MIGMVWDTETDLIVMVEDDPSCAQYWPSAGTGGGAGGAGDTGGIGGGKEEDEEGDEEKGTVTWHLSPPRTEGTHGFTDESNGAHGDAGGVDVNAGGVRHSITVRLLTERRGVVTRLPEGQCVTVANLTERVMEVTRLTHRTHRTRRTTSASAERAAEGAAEGLGSVSEKRRITQIVAGGWKRGEGAFNEHACGSLDEETGFHTMLAGEIAIRGDDMRESGVREW